MTKTRLGNVMGPKGDRGRRGSEWRVSEKMTGRSTGGTAFPGAGLGESIAGDMCLNPLTCDIYRCTAGGDAASARWAWVANSRGPQGERGPKGNPTSVDAALSATSGNPVQNRAVHAAVEGIRGSLAGTVRAEALYSGRATSDFTLSASTAGYKSVLVQAAAPDGLVFSTMEVVAPNGKTVDLASSFYTNGSYRYLRIRCRFSGARVSVAINDRWDSGAQILHHDLAVTSVVGFKW